MQGMPPCRKAQQHRTSPYSQLLLKAFAHGGGICLAIIKCRKMLKVLINSADRSICLKGR